MMGWIRARSDGNPLFLGELARLVGAENVMATVPSGLDQVLAARLAHLGPDAAVLSRAALIGREFEVGVLARLGEDDGEAISRALAAGVRAGLIGQSRRSGCVALLARAGCRGRGGRSSTATCADGCTCGSRR